MGEEICLPYGRQEWHAGYVGAWILWRVRMSVWMKDDEQKYRRVRVGCEKVETVIDKTAKGVGLSKWKTEMERKKTLEWYREKELPMYVRWYDGSLGGDLLFRARAQCMDVNARNYRWSESRSKVCQMYDMGEDETVEHVVLECEKYDRDIMEIMREMGSEMN